jgi:Rhodopirellula transposase DDE domain
MLKLMRGTTTQTGLKVEAALIRGKFLTKVKVSDQEMAELHVVRRRVHPQWNYVIKPRSSCPKKV